MPRAQSEISGFRTQERLASWRCPVITARSKSRLGFLRLLRLADRESEPSLALGPAGHRAGPATASGRRHDPTGNECSHADRRLPLRLRGNLLRQLQPRRDQRFRGRDRKRRHDRWRGHDRRRWHDRWRGHDRKRRHDGQRWNRCRRSRRKRRFGRQRGIRRRGRRDQLRRPDVLGGANLRAPELRGRGAGVQPGSRRRNLPDWIHAGLLPTGDRGRIRSGLPATTLHPARRLLRRHPRLVPEPTDVRLPADLRLSQRRHVRERQRQQRDLLVGLTHPGSGRARTEPADRLLASVRGVYSRHSLEVEHATNPWLW